MAGVLVFPVFDKNRMLLFSFFFFPRQNVYALDVKCSSQPVPNIFIYKDVDIFISACIGSIGEKPFLFFIFFQHIY